MSSRSPEKAGQQAALSSRLSAQSLDALRILMAGFDGAEESSSGVLQGADTDHLYGGLLTALLRIIVLLYDEDQARTTDDIAPRFVSSLYERLRADAACDPDTMHRRSGAWAALTARFRLVHQGGRNDDVNLTARHGQLFDPDAYPFLEGRHGAPKVSDSCLLRVLERLMVLDGQRLSYPALDVELIGSVYESMLGFALERAAAPSIAVRPRHIVVNLTTLLAQEPRTRSTWLKDRADCRLSPAEGRALRVATSTAEAVAALGKKRSPRTPRVLPRGSLYLQPGEERRRSGSHYTPRALTAPIIETTLRPVLQALGPHPTPAQILGLKVCDPAMGSGAFLLEVCRQLGAHLLEAWRHHASMPELAGAERPQLHARRLVAQRCLYGVDKNPLAVSLARLSLWLLTRAKHLPFGFLDHALKCGDSLVGMTRAEIDAFCWGASPGRTDTAPQSGSGENLRLKGDLLTAAFFAGHTAAARELRRQEYLGWWRDAHAGRAQAMENVRLAVSALRSGEAPVMPFHWEIALPGAFEPAAAGFDCVVGNPPFLGGTMISTHHGARYLAFLKVRFQGIGNRADLVAYFFRCAFQNLNTGGCLGLISTNTIGQGDTRAGGLQQLQQRGGTIYNATRRRPWPGLASVIVSMVHVSKRADVRPVRLDGEDVERITSFLFHTGPNESPQSLAENQQIPASLGVKPYGEGFVFQDGNTSASPMSRLESIRQRRDVSAVVKPFIGGSRLNTDPRQHPNRFIIDLGRLDETVARRAQPELMAVLEEKVKPDRSQKSAAVRRTPWWRFYNDRANFFAQAKALELSRYVVTARNSQTAAFCFLPASVVANEKVVIFASGKDAFLAILQCRVHEIWSRFFNATLKDDLQYAISDCYHNFPFPADWADQASLEASGASYSRYRAALMADAGFRAELMDGEPPEGLTKTYNRFHDPRCHLPGIVRLRALHAELDRAVLDAYGWQDITPTCDFRLDHPIDEETWSPRKKKPYRYRWSNDVRDTVLARLLELNQERASIETKEKGHPRTGSGP